MSSLEQRRNGSGLHTRDDLTWVGRLRLWVRRQSRDFYRQARHRKHRSGGGWRRWFAEKIRNRALWRAERQSVAAGLAGGLFFAMLPVPLQSFIAAGVGMARGWNLPAAVSATWLSNPFTYIPMLLGARWTAMGFFALFGREAAVGGLNIERLKEVADAAMGLHLRTAWGMAGPALLELVFGMVLLGVLLGVLGYVSVQIFWGLAMSRRASRAA